MDTDYSKDAQSNAPNKNGNKTAQECGKIEIVTTVCAIIIVIVTSIQAGFLYWSNIVAAHSADAAKQSADVAKQSVELASDTAKKQLQAYIFAIEGQVIGLEGNGPMKIRITINNSGQTPAYETTVEMDTQWEKYPPPPPQAGAMLIKEGARAVLAPGKEFYIEHNVDKPLRQNCLGKQLHFKLLVIFTIKMFLVSNTTLHSILCKVVNMILDHHSWVLLKVEIVPIELFAIIFVT